MDGNGVLVVGVIPATHTLEINMEKKRIEKYFMVSFINLLDVRLTKVVKCFKFKENLKGSRNIAIEIIFNQSFFLKRSLLFK